MLIRKSMTTLKNLLSIFSAKKPSYHKTVNATATRLQDELDKYEADIISKKTFLTRSQKILSKAYKTAYKSGSGVSGYSELGQEWLDEFSNSQFSFLAKFADDIENGLGSMDTDARMKMYADSVKSAWYAGSTLESDDGTLFDWVLGDAENCEDCVGRSENGPYTLDGLPGFPGDGSTVCMANCKCSIVRSN